MVYILYITKFGIGTLHLDVIGVTYNIKLVKYNYIGNRILNFSFITIESIDIVDGLDGYTVDKLKTMVRGNPLLAAEYIIVVSNLWVQSIINYFFSIIYI